MNNGARPARKYRIAYLIDGLSMGGAERLMVPILKHLNRQDFDAHVCALQYKDGNPMADEIRALGIPVECLQMKHLRDLNAIPNVMRYLKMIRADLVHTQLEAANILGNISAKILRLPSMCTIHVMPSLDVKTKTRLHQKVEWFVLRHFCDTVIAVSEESGQYHTQISGALAHQVVTVYNGIDLSAFQRMDHTRERTAVREELGIPTDANVLITVAVLRPQKGIQFMIQALPEVLASHPNTYYVVVGGGSHESALKAEVAKAVVPDRVIFTGMRKDIARLMIASDIFVLPTLTEALPTVLAEAMAARLPIIASRVGGIPEMIVDGKNGCLVEPENLEQLSLACVELLGDDEKRAAMGIEGLQIVHQKFNIERQVERLRELYLDHLHAYGK